MERIERSETDPALYPALLEALESKPQATVPRDFAARMGLLAGAEPVRNPLPHTHYGQTAAWLSLIILTAVVVTLAPSTTSSGMTATLEYMLLAQLLALALWLGTRTFPGTR